MATKNSQLNWFTAFAYGIAFISLNVNVAVESPIFFVGTMLALSASRLSRHIQGSGART